MLDALKRLWPLRRKAPEAAPFPLSLAASQVAALKEWRSHPAYSAYQHVVGELARARLARLLTTDPQTVEFERGALAALTEVHDVVDIILTKCEELHDRTSKRNGATKPDHRSTFWGSPNFY